MVLPRQLVIHHAGIFINNGLQLILKEHDIQMDSEWFHGFMDSYKNTASIQDGSDLNNYFNSITEIR